ncbi:MAG: DUF790 family protein [Lentisphaeria bacterium]
MLTKDLIRCRIRNHNQIMPCFIDCDKADYLEFAAKLIEVYRQGIHSTRGEIEALLMPILRHFPKLQLAKSFKKLLEDRAVFSTSMKLDYIKFRKEILLLSASLYRQKKWDNPASLFEKMKDELGGEQPLLKQGRLYADLPDSDVLQRMKDLTATQLLQRYNLAQVQGLLFFADQLDVVVSSTDPQKLRRLFKYLRFFRLLAKISCERVRGDITGGKLHLEIAGPASVLGESRRYGLQLASFFPAICSLESWKMEAGVTWKNRRYQLVLDPSSLLVCPYHNFSAYVPDEIKLFHRHFKETVDHWQITGETPFLHGEGRNVLFPDLSFVNSEGALFHLELFHRWHHGKILEQLKWLEKHPKLPLILGIDRFLLKQDSELEDYVNHSLWFADYGFLFHDYPTVNKTLQCLEKKSKNWTKK